MKLKIKVNKKSDLTYLKEVEFDHFPVILGRDEKCQLVLPDPFKIISRKHAQIIDTEGILQLIDLNTPNFTYLNDQRIESIEENPINSGDIIRIGEYQLEVELLVEKKFIPTEDDQKTMVFTGPYKEEIINISDSFKRIAEIYTADESPVKSNALRFSVLQAFNNMDKNDVTKIMAEYFAENFLENELFPIDKKANSSINNFGEEQNINEPFSFTKQTGLVNKEFTMEDFTLSSYFTNIIDILLETFSRLISGFLQFRQELFGITVYYTFPANSLKELKEFLFDPAISPEEEKKRINLLKDETQSLLSHQIGLLEGYQQSITEGSKLLLQSIDPDVIGSEMEKKSTGLDIGRVIPLTRKSKILDKIKENYQKYISDLNHIEKKFFRPPFMQAYQKRMVNKHQNDF